MADQLLIRRQCTFSMLPASPSVDSSAQWKLKFTMPFICDTARFAFTQHCMRSLNSQKSACGKMSNWSSRKFHFSARALYKVEINCCAPEKGSKWKSRNVLNSLNRNPKCNLLAYTPEKARRHKTNRRAPENPISNLFPLCEMRFFLVRKRPQTANSIQRNEGRHWSAASLSTKDQVVELQKFPFSQLAAASPAKQNTWERERERSAHSLV